MSQRSAVMGAVAILGLGAVLGLVQAQMAPLQRIERAEAGVLRQIEVAAEEARLAFEGGQAFFLDARSDEQRSTLSRVPGAMVLSIRDFSGNEVPTVLQNLPMEGRFIVLCEDPKTCDAADLVVLRMAGLGYMNAKVLQGGMVGWRAQGWPVEGP